MRKTSNKHPYSGVDAYERKGYIPTTKDGYAIKSGTVSMKAGRYYVSALVEVPNVNVRNNTNDGVGIDLGLKDLRSFRMAKYTRTSISLQD